MTLPESSTISGAQHHRAPPVPTSHLYIFCCAKCGSLPLVITVLCALLLPCTTDERWAGVRDSLGRDDGCASDGEAIGVVGGGKSSPECASLEHACARYDSFCFPSTLPDLFDGQKKCRSSSLAASGHPFQIGDAYFRWVSDGAVYRLLDGKAATCSAMNANGSPPMSGHMNQNDGNSCGGPLPPVAWIRESSGMTTTTTDQLSLQIESSLSGTSLSPHVEINPPLLDWGFKSLYSPSCTSLTVVNTHNDTTLHLSEPFSTDPQYYLHGFQELSIPPGKSASISFTFLPRRLGSSSAQILLQTSYGGFIIQAKGRAVESSYRVQPLLEFEVSENGRLHNNFFLYNPFDEVLHVEQVSVFVIFDSGNMSHSSHVVCQTNASQHPVEEISPFSSHNGPSILGIRPQKKWEVSPRDASPVLEVSLASPMEGNCFGVICMRLKRSSQDEIKTVMVPLEAYMQHKVGYHALTGSVSVHVEPLRNHDGEDPIHLLSLRNGGSALLQLLKVNEITDSKKIFSVRYTKGLLLYPGTLTLIAFITDTSPTDSWGMPHEFPCRNSNCMLQIVTNESTSPQIEIPCRALVYTCFRHEHTSLPVASKHSSIGLRFGHVESANEKNTLSGRVPNEHLSKQSNSLEAAEADELILRNWKYQGSRIEMSVLDDHELLFPLVEVGSQCSKWISVQNPSQKPVVMQLLLSSGSVIDHCKSAFDFSEHNAMHRSAHITSVEASDGFFVGNPAIVEALIHPFEKAVFGPIVFHPSERCMWRSSALIRNNLSGVEWLPLQGIGGSHSLTVLEDSKPIQRLEFNVDWLIPFNESAMGSTFQTEQASANCGHFLSKELEVKNTGELSLEVLKLEVSGTSCGIDGFKVHTCEAFTLAPGESVKLHVSYQSDFSSGVIYRDLELALASGLIVIPMKANISIYMMNICGRSFIWSLVKTMPLMIFFAFSMTFLFLLTPTFPSSSGDYMPKGGSKAIATITKVGKDSIHPNPKNARSDKDIRPKASNASRYSVSTIGKQNNTKNMVSKQDFEYQDKAPSLESCSEVKSSEEPGRSNASDASQIGNLTIRITGEKGRRRKRKASRTAGLATKLEVSSSQSGNSTPSSPMTPHAPTPKQAWPVSPRTPSNQVAAERKWEEDRAAGSSFDATHEPAISINCHRNARKPALINGKPTMKPFLLPSPTFPASGWRGPAVSAPQKFLAATSPIAPHARAPGSKVGRDAAVKRDEEAFHGKELIYDIWGNHIADHIMGRCKELSPRPFSGASEGDSPSFFARGPQSLMKMSSARPTSAASNPLAYDVNYNNQMQDLNQSDSPPWELSSTLN